MGTLAKQMAWGWRQYTVLDGLAGMRVEDILQDAEGSVWIATADGGVSRFDGTNFDNLTECDGLPHPTVMAMAEPVRGELAFGTMGGGVAFWDGAKAEVLGAGGGLPSDDVLGLRAIGAGELLVFTTAGIARVGRRRVLATVTEVGGKALGWVYDLVRDGNDQTWLATLEHGVVDLDGSPMEVQEGGR